MLKITNLTKRIGNHTALDGVSFIIHPGEIVAVIGASGSGKSTLLRCINQLEQPDSGQVDLRGLPIYQIGMVFQHFNLFHNMTLWENMIYPQTTTLKRTIEHSTDRANDMLQRMNLKGLEHRMPHRLSGGQKQRGAIARTLCMDPKLILFDEPTSALDPENVREVLTAIRDVSAMGITIMIVTHEMGFARDIADRVLFLDHGKLLEDTDKDEFFLRPKSSRAQLFLEQVLWMPSIPV